MKRFFCPKENISSDTIRITDSKEMHHIISVMRCAVEDAVTIFDGEGTEYQGRITAMNQKAVSLSIKSKRRGVAQGVRVTIACAIPKKSKLDAIIERCSELGVERIIPLVTKRTVVRLTAQQRQCKQARWKRIALAACRQSGRAAALEVEEVKDFSEALVSIKDYDTAIIPCLEGERQGLYAVLDNLQGARVLAFIGPEGDFTLGEISEAKRLGCRAVSFGSIVLRVETAAVYLASIFKYRYGGDV